MRLFRIFALSAALLTTSGWAFGQGYYHDDHHRDRDDSQIYRQGYDQGRMDARMRRGFHPDANRYRSGGDRLSYRNGYQAGYSSMGGGDRDRDRDHDRDHDRDRNYNGYPSGSYGGGRGYGNANSIAQQNGYRDGQNDGVKDRNTGHSFRPTQGDNYKNAPGYSSSMGDRQQYKDMYRQAYQQGYQLGYNGRR
jgi:hypothetical protein